MSDEFKKPVENLKISYDYVNEMLDLQYDINMKFVKDVSDSLDSEIIGMLTPSQLKKNAKVVMLLETLKMFMNNSEVKKSYYGTNAILAEFEDEYNFAEKALKEFNGEGDV